jgi:hypothetical protein
MKIYAMNECLRASVDANRITQKVKHYDVPIFSSSYRAILLLCWVVPFRTSSG